MKEFSAVEFIFELEFFLKEVDIALKELVVVIVESLNKAFGFKFIVNKVN